jgi:hypothetical protein
VVVSGKAKLLPRKRRETEESIRNVERQNIAAAGKIWNFELPPTTESDESFSWTGHAPSRVGRRREKE